MTSKLTITRERLQEIAEDGFLKHGESKILARMALAAMDSEPVAEVVSIYGDGETIGEREIRPLIGIQQIPYGTKLYRHAQPAPNNRAITQYFDTIALETAREILCDINRRHEFLGGEVQLLSRIQCRIDGACRAAMLQAAPVCTCPSGDGSLRWPCPSHPGNSPVIPDGWTGNDKANAALMMLDRIETVDPVDDDRIDGIKHIIHELAAAPQEVKGE